MWNFKCNKLTDRITQIVDPSDVSSFLVTGDKEAVLIDTGIGLAGMRRTVEELTDLPVTVVLTHAHGDHAGGIAEFDSVYLHPADQPLLSEHGLPMRMEYAQAMLGPDVKLSESDFAPEPDGNLKELCDGQIFDLGGVSLEIIHVPGHTKGSCCVLIPEERAILCGDACNVNTLIIDPDTGTDISTYKRSLEYLKTYDGRYQTVLYSHGPAAGPNCLDDNIELCGRILAGKDDKLACDFLGTPALRAAAINDSYERTDGRFGNIVYTERTRK